MPNGRMMRAPVSRRRKLLDRLRDAMRSRGSFGIHLSLSDGCDIHTVQELPGYKDVRATMVYSRVLNRGGKGVRSSIDLLLSPGDKGCYTETI
jgi:hypothetical protein